MAVGQVATRVPTFTSNGLTVKPHGVALRFLPRSPSLAVKRVGYPFTVGWTERVSDNHPHKPRFEPGTSASDERSDHPGTEPLLVWDLTTFPSVFFIPTDFVRPCNRALNWSSWVFLCLIWLWDASKLQHIVSNKTSWKPISFCLKLDNILRSKIPRMDYQTLPENWLISC